MSQFFEITEDQAQSLLDIIREHSDGDGVMLTHRPRAYDEITALPVARYGTLIVTFTNHEARINEIGEYTFT